MSLGVTDVYLIVFIDQFIELWAMVRATEHRPVTLSACVASCMWACFEIADDALYSFRHSVYKGRRHLQGEIDAGRLPPTCSL